MSFADKWFGESGTSKITPRVDVYESTNKGFSVKCSEHGDLDNWFATPGEGVSAAEKHIQKEHRTLDNPLDLYKQGELLKEYG